MTMLNASSHQMQVMLRGQVQHPATGPLEPRLTEARTVLTVTERMAGSVMTSSDIQYWQR